MTECSVCLDAFTDPQQLPCGHSFCGGCLEPIRQRPGLARLCPFCRQAFDRVPVPNFALRDALARAAELKTELEKAKADAGMELGRVKEKLEQKTKDKTALLDRMQRDKDEAAEELNKSHTKAKELHAHRWEMFVSKHHERRDLTQELNRTKTELRMEADRHRTTMERAEGEMRLLRGRLERAERDNEQLLHGAKAPKIPRRD